jgi:hypothetical protein
MATVTRDSIPLSDEAAIRAIVLELSLNPISPKEDHRSRRLFWEKYFYHSVQLEVWSRGSETWLRVDGDVLRRTVITGLKSEREARALRLECLYHRRAGESLENIVVRFVSDTEREARQRHDTFIRCLRDVRRYFKWQDGEVVEGSGRFLPISKMDLPAEDVEVLKQVFMRLRESSSKHGAPLKLEEAACPKCGSDRKRSRSVVKDLTTARERVMQHSGDFADEGFAAWVERCLQTKTDTWSRARAPLYDHYRKWMHRGGNGASRGERVEAKATALSEVKWGRLMRRRFPNDYRRDPSGILYRVALKRGA